LSKIASIDIGSNTLRLLIAEKTETGFVPIWRDREIVRLGRGFYPDRCISPETIEAALRVLKRFKSRIDEQGACPVRSAATGVLREARNVRSFLKRVQEEIGLEITVISGQEEAGVMAAGVLSAIKPGLGKGCFFDIGGGSTEFVFLDQGEMQDRVSLPLGVVGLTERFLASDPPAAGESEDLIACCQKILRKNLSKSDKLEFLVGTAGTVTTLAAMVKGLSVYDPDQINGTILTRELLSKLARNLSGLPQAEKAQLPGLDPGRADIIFSGLLLVLEILDVFSKDDFQVSDAGLLEGLLLEKGSAFSVSKEKINVFERSIHAQRD
jgi:exopolyphosphatase/guanosine-5'-triphosphate,3'-diphosphate pyrophosphatase